MFEESKKYPQNFDSEASAKRRLRWECNIKMILEK
jgi:hypothetical protein